MRIQDKYYPYPQECFGPNIALTLLKKKAFEKKYDAFYDALEKAYPGYYQMEFRERMEAREEIKRRLGYRI